MNHINFQDKKVLVRVDFNVPLLKSLAVADNTRIEKAIPTLKAILEKGAKALIVCTHLGRPKTGADNSSFSTKHIVSEFSNLLGKEVEFVDDCIGEKVENAIAELEHGGVLLLENTRFYDEETEGEENFSKSLASVADIYINDAFGTAHRAHASTTKVAHYFDKDHKGFGYLMDAEVTNGNKVLLNSDSPFTAIVGGAKVSDKIKLLENLIDKANNILIGGGMAFTFKKALGGNIGKSLCETDLLSLSLEILEKAKSKGCNIYLPEDSIAASAFSAEADIMTVASDHIDGDWMGLDIGPKAVETYSEIIKKSKTIIWNGPMGVFEFEKFSNGTFSVAQAVADATALGAFSLIGGGDSVAAINKAGLEDKVSFISTGGGAMLEFLEGKILPGITAIQE
jgi:phosphoglycerate kinase